MVGYGVYRGFQWKRALSYARRRRPTPAVTILPATISGSSSATATGSLSLGTGGPAYISPNASNAQTTGTLNLVANANLGALSSTATADGTLSLATSSAIGVRAAPGWLGLFVVDTSGGPIPTIGGSSSATSSGALSLLVPSPAQIIGSSQARAIASMTLTLGRGGAALIIRDTYVTSAQFGSKSVQSDTFGDRSTYIHPESTIG